MPSKIETRGRNRESRDGKTIRKLRNLRYSDAEWRWLKKRAKADGVSVAAFVRAKTLVGMPARNPNART